MKKILLMMPTLTQGGFERVCLLTARMLNEEYDVTVLVFTMNAQFYNVSDLNVINIDVPALPGKLNKIVNVLRRVKKLRKIRKENKYDIVYSFGTSANLINVLSKTYGKTWMGVRVYEAIDNKMEMLLKTRLADKVICCSKVIEEGILNNFKVKDITTVYNPCDIDRIEYLVQQENALEYEELLKSSTPIVMSMGRADDQKGFWHLVKAFSLVKKEIQDVKLMIMGAGDFGEYEILASEMGIAEDVIFLTAQENPFQYLKYASLYMLTSRSEGFPNALIEAMAVGIPVMAVNCKSGPAEILGKKYEEVLDDTKLYYAEYGVILPMVKPIKNLDSNVIETEERIMAEEMVKILRNSELLNDYAIKAKERASEFGTERYIQRIKDML